VQQKTSGQSRQEPSPSFGGQEWRSLEDSLNAITCTARRTIDWADHVSIALSYDPSAVDTVGATDAVAVKADALQSELGEGPSVDAVGHADLVHARDVVADVRWAAYGPRVAELGVVAQTSVRLAHEDSTVGVLTLYSRHAHDLDTTAEALTRLVAVQATTAVAFASTLHAQTQAIASRQVIGQAIGIVMERRGLDESEAFTHLVEESQRTQVKLRLIARSMVDQANQRSGSSQHITGRAGRRDGDNSALTPA
jgi:hypothetical protein